MEVGNGVPEGEQVHLHGAELAFHGTGYSEHVRPVFAGRIGVEFGRLRHVTVPPNDHAVAREPASALQANLARDQPGNEHGMVIVTVATEPGA
jgi:hypothetical protein